MTWYAPISRTTTVTAPGQSDGIYIAANVTVSVQSNFGLAMQSLNHTALIYGAVISAESVGAFLGNLTTEKGHNVTVMEGGEIRSFGDCALWMRGQESFLENHGTIAGNQAIEIETGISGGQSLIMNYGLIEGQFSGISSSGDEAIEIHNYGVIEVLFGSSAIALAGGDDTVINRGKILNQVALFGGDDFYDGSKGFSHDQISGGDGEDTIIGGRSQDTISGGNDTDRLRGRGGSDTFVFDDGGNADTDIILDFTATRSKHDILDLGTVDTITGFADLKKNHLEVHGKDIWIESGDGDIAILKKVALNQLDGGDFLFAN